MAEVSDGTRLNLASQLAATAADLQAVRSKRARTTDPTMTAALEDVRAAVASLCAAVGKLSAIPTEDDPPEAS